MTAEDDLRSLLQAAAVDAGSPRVDPSSIVRRSHRARRRRTAVVGAGMAVVVAVAAVVVVPDLADRDAAREEEVVAAGDRTTGWVRLPDPPLEPRAGASAVWTGEEVLVFGGDDLLCSPVAECDAGPEDVTVFTDGAAYDPETASWRPIADPPWGIVDLRAVSVARDAFAVVPSDLPAGAGDPLLVRYRAADDAWTTYDAPPEMELHPYQLTAAGDTLVVASVSDEAGELVDHRFDPASERWTALPDDPLPPSYDRQVVAAGDDLLLFAKALGAEPSSPVLAARFEGATSSWRRLPDAPGTGFDAWPVDGVVVLDPHFSVESGGGVFDPATEAWSPLEGLTGLADRSTFTGDMAGVIGATEARYGRLGGWTYLVDRGAWMLFEPMDDRTGAATATVGRQLFAFGGEEWATPEGRLLGDAWMWTPAGDGGAADERASVVVTGPEVEGGVRHPAVMVAALRLDAARGCVGFGDGDGELSLPVVFPHGTAGFGDGVRLPDGRELRFGEVVELAGGEVPADELPELGVADFPDACLGPDRVVWFAADLGADADLGTDLGSARPTVWAREASDQERGLLAAVGGTVRYDAVLGCFQLDSGGGRPPYPVVWPAGTTAASDGDGVVLPDGTRARVGATVEGAGGFLAADAFAFDIPAGCRHDSGDVAAFDADGDVVVSQE